MQRIEVGCGSQGWNLLSISRSLCESNKGSGMSSSNQCIESITLFYQCIQQVGIYLSEGFRMSQQQCEKKIDQFMKAGLCPFSCGSDEVGSS